MSASGTMKGKNAISFIERAKRKDFVVMIPNKLIPLMKPNKDMRVVDFCTGTGNIIPFFKDNVKEFVAIDASKEMVDFIKKNYSKQRNLNIIESDVAKVPIESNKYDVVIIKFSLHHIYNADPVVKEAYRVLKKGGKFYIIDMVFDDSFIFRLVEPFWRLSKAISKGRHEFFCKYRNNKQISRLLEKNNFKINYKDNINENDQRYRNKHYPTYIYEAVK